jgi:hypothetical protein
MLALRKVFFSDQRKRLRGAYTNLIYTIVIFEKYNKVKCCKSIK